MGTNMDPCVAGSVAMISYKPLLVNLVHIPASTYTLFPSPVPTHEVTVLSFLILKVTVWSVVDAGSEFGVREDVVNDLPGVTVP